VELAELADAGLKPHHLRWLEGRGVIAHRAETTRAGRGRRHFRTEGRGQFGPRTCVVLTAAGADLIRAGRSSESPGATALPGPSGQEVLAPVPSWVAEGRKLFVGRELVKFFRQPAPDQEVLLSAFEEEHWAERIDDPLPPVEGRVQKRRLAKTIENLNRGHQVRLIRFRGDGRGEGVMWELIGGP
jgi:hypothetical protein